MKNSKIFTSFILVIFLIILSSCSFPFLANINLPAVETATTATADTSTLSQEYQPLTVTFLDVGQADCTLLQCGEEAMLIDGGNPDDAQKIYSVLKKHEITQLKAIIITHAHEDHYGSIAAALTAAPAETVYAPVEHDNSEGFNDITERTDITIPEIGTTFSLGSANVEFLAPVKQYDDDNNTSIVCKVTNGEDTFLFTGDMERDAELDLIDTSVNLTADVLKVGHHGSNSSTSYVFLREVMPKYAVISCGKNNSYGHPHQEVVSRLKDAEATIYRTDQIGDIIAISSGNGIEFNVQEQEASSNVTEQTAPLQYIGNKNSKVFHRSSCSSLPKEKNRIYFDSRQEAIEASFKPCGNCQP